MPDEVDNHTIRLLQEMRQEAREANESLSARIDGVAEQLDGLTLRLDGNTVILNMLAGLLHDHEEPIGSLELSRR